EAHATVPIHDRNADHRIVLLALVDRALGDHERLIDGNVGVLERLQEVVLHQLLDERPGSGDRDDCADTDDEAVEKALHADPPREDGSLCFPGKTLEHEGWPGPEPISGLAFRPRRRGSPPAFGPAPTSSFPEAFQRPGLRSGAPARG